MCLCALYSLSGRLFGPLFGGLGCGILFGHGLKVRSGPLILGGVAQTNISIFHLDCERQCCYHLVLLVDLLFPPAIDRLCGYAREVNPRVFFIRSIPEVITEMEGWCPQAPTGSQRLPQRHQPSHQCAHAHGLSEQRFPMEGGW